MTESPSPERVNILLPAGDERGDAALVAHILERLRAHPLIRAALAGDAATPPAGFVSLADLDQRPPPAGVPFYNEAIGVLSVPAPQGDAVGAVRAALGELAAGLDIQPETSFQTQ